VRDDIERTREQMSETVDAIAERTAPRRIVRRQRRRMSEGVRHLRDTVMGTAEDAYDTAQTRVHDAVDEVRHAPEALKSQTQGSPLAAGLIAFGAGALVAAVIPSTRTERQAAQRLQSEAQPAVEQLKQAGHEIADEVKGSAQQAVEEVKSTARDSAQQVTDEAKTAAQQVRQQQA
jgi:hypothetical protein